METSSDGIESLTNRMTADKQYGTRTIVIGIPSYNEADTIGTVVTAVDLGLRRYFPDAECLIVNVDSKSTDGTGRVFLATKTKTAKLYINSGNRPRGKGKNLLTLFQYCDRHRVDFVGVLDSDIRSIEPRWVHLLIQPLVSGRYDYVTPVYSRSCYDGNVTNNFAYPFTYAVFGVDIQQPIGGEFGINRKFYRYILKQPVDRSVRGFGIDIFMTLHAIGGGFRITEASLGAKRHKPAFPTLMNKFSQFSHCAIKVSKTYLHRLDRVRQPNKHRRLQIRKVRKPPDPHFVATQLRHFRTMYQRHIREYQSVLGRTLANNITDIIVTKNTPKVSSSLWTSVLAKSVRLCYRKNLSDRSIVKICDLIAPVFYWRVISFWKDMSTMRAADIDREIRKNARLLRRKMSRETQ